MNEHESLWISITERRRQIAELDQGKLRKRIVILGAGMAGLAAAYELQRLQHRVSLIEWWASSNTSVRKRPVW